MIQSGFKKLKTVKGLLVSLMFFIKQLRSSTSDLTVADNAEHSQPTADFTHAWFNGFSFFSVLMRGNAIIREVAPFSECLYYSVDLKWVKCGKVGNSMQLCWSPWFIWGKWFCLAAQLYLLQLSDGTCAQKYIYYISFFLSSLWTSWQKTFWLLWNFCFGRSKRENKTEFKEVPAAVDQHCHLVLEMFCFLTVLLILSICLL